MSCIKACYDESSAQFGHEDCNTCPWADNGPRRNVDSADTSPECVEETAESIHDTSDELVEKDCGGHHHRYAGSFGGLI